MKYLVSLLLVCSFHASFASAEATAKKNKISKEKIEALVLQYHMQKAAGLVKNVALVCEEPSLSSCVDTAASFMSSYEINEKPEILEVTRACMGNSSGQCLSLVATLIPSHEMNDRNEVAQVLNACKGYQTTECLQVVGKSIQAYEMNDREEVIQILNSCNGR